MIDYININRKLQLLKDLWEKHKDQSFQIGNMGYTYIWICDAIVLGIFGRNEKYWPNVLLTANYIWRELNKLEE